MSETTTPRYPHVKVQLTDQDGNAFAIIGRCRQAARAKQVSATEIATFSKEAMSGGYNDLLVTCTRWFTCQ